MQPRNPAVREGLLFGGGLAVLLVLNFVFETLTGNSLGGIIVVLAALAAYLVAGMRAAQATGRMQSGLIAGLVTGLFSSLVNAVVVIALSFVFVDRLRDAAQKAADALGVRTVHYTNTMILTSEVIGVLLGAAFATALGLGLGALGGNIGKSRAPLPQQAYQESFYQGISPSPQYPPMPQQTLEPEPPQPQSTQQPVQSESPQWTPPQQP